MDIKRRALAAGVSFDLTRLPIIGPWLCRLLGGGLGSKPGKPDKKGTEENLWKK